MVSNEHLRHGERFLRFELIHIFVNLGLSFSPEAEARFLLASLRTKNRDVGIRRSALAGLPNTRCEFELASRAGFRMGIHCWLPRKACKQRVLFQRKSRSGRQLARLPRP
jgi:hypothetical protein